LSAERDRVLEQLESNDVVCDLFAGVGPFAIRAAKKGCRVIANDLNPSCLHYLNKNIQKNKVSHLVHSYNLDARDFFKQLSSGNSEGDWLPFTHIYMNLPMDAIEFLDVFRGAFDRDLWKSLPKVHVYGFAMEQEELIERMKQVWGVFNQSILTFHRFRDISPKKYMFCVEFVIPEEIAFEVLPRKIAKSEEASEN
jgi:tRNA (guanine37-N1)-methyltransferase